MQHETRMRTVAVAAAMSLAIALPIGAAETEKVEAESALSGLLTSDGLTRGELAGLYETVIGGGQTPPDCVPGEEMFDDVPASNPFCPWIEELARRGVTGGCDADNYCPNDPVSRSQMAIFIVRAMDAPEFVDRDGEDVTIPAGESRFATASCEPGEQLVSGGGLWLNGGTSNAPDLHIVHSFHNTGTEWGARGYNGTAVDQPFRVVIVCRRTSQ